MNNMETEFRASLTRAFTSIGFRPTTEELEKLIKGSNVETLEKRFYSKIYKADQQGSMYTAPIRFQAAKEMNLLLFLQKELDYTSNTMLFVIGMLCQMEAGSGIYGIYEKEKKEYDKLERIKEGFSFTLRDGEFTATITVKEVLTPYIYILERIWSDGQIDKLEEYSFSRIKTFI